ncbi:tape measure protein [Ruminiclostridium josui]|uniref:tape measure protein n=1 Tax=Ruminiclostridium josui TaxID=1499 RepID=UPI000465801B|nr:tape measure protein [Ruminiclostridium josui]
MGRDISIAINAKDNYTQAITTMKNANQAFNKDLTGLNSKLDALNKNKITLKVDVSKAKKELSEAEKQFAKTGEAADKLNLELANAKYENARRNLSLVSDNAKQAEKDIRSLTNAVSKNENRASASRNQSTMGSVLGTIAASGAASLIGDTIGGITSTYVSSAYGSEASTIFNSALSTAGMGAAIGTAIAPGIGTAVGAALGGIIGVIQGNAQVFEKKDDSFKQYYQDQFKSVIEEQNNSLSSGSGIASSREQNKISFSTLLGGDKNATSYLKDITKFASDTPFEYDDLTKISKTLLAYRYKQNEIIPLLTKVGDAGSALGMSTDDMTWVSTALGRMKSTGKTSLEYLNPLLERGIPVWDYLAKASGKTNKQVQEMVSKGLIPGEKAAQAIADYMGYDFAGNMKKQAQTYSGLVSTLEDAQNQINNAMGEGYNEERKKGIQSQISYLSGDSGTKMQEAYNQIGQWKASLENLAEQFKRNALSAVMSGSISSEFSEKTQARLSEMYKEYTQYAADGSKDAGAKMGALLAEAQAIAQDEYNASEGAQLAIQTNKTLAENIKNDAGLNQSYWDAGYQMGKQFSLGLASAIKDKSDDNKITFGLSNSGVVSIDKNPSNAITNLFGGSNGNIQSSGKNKFGFGNGYAVGLSYVPYNNFPTVLHEGERVLTASENRSYGQNAAPVITGNSFVIREEADIQKVAIEIVRQMNRANELAD